MTEQQHGIRILPPPKEPDKLTDEEKKTGREGLAKAREKLREMGR